MGDHEDRGAGGVELADELHDRRAGGAVEVAGRLVGEHDRRPPDEGPGDRHPLPLASGELGRLERRAVGQADPFERLVGARVPLGGGDAGVEHPVGDVLAHRGVLGQEELLEDEPDLPGPQPRHLAVAQPRRVDPADPDHAAAGPLQRPDDVQQRGLARPGGPDDRHQLAPPDGEGHPSQGEHRGLLAVDLGDLVQLQYRVAHIDGTTTAIACAQIALDLDPPASGVEQAQLSRRPARVAHRRARPRPRTRRRTCRPAR